MKIVMANAFTFFTLGDFIFFKKFVHKNASLVIQKTCFKKKNDLKNLLTENGNNKQRD
jgi:hypothetical protein